jgi:hypothetical protein
MEGTYRNPEAVIADAEQFAQVGIPVEVVALAVREERSRLDALGRSLPAADAEMGRWVFPDRQVEAYCSVPAAVAAAEAIPAVQRVIVTSRQLPECRASWSGATTKECHSAGAEGERARQRRRAPQDPSPSLLCRCQESAVTRRISMAGTPSASFSGP